MSRASTPAISSDDEESRPVKFDDLDNPDDDDDDEDDDEVVSFN